MEIVDRKFETIILEIGIITKLIINRPDKSNSLNSLALTEITDALSMLDEIPYVKVIIIKGLGKGFCSGGDLSGMDGTTETMNYRSLNRKWPSLLGSITKIGKIVIAQVHGYALAGGLGLACACDITIVSDNAKLGTPEIKRALYPFVITAPLSRCIPQKKLLEMCFTGKLVAPNEAVEYGLANYAVPESEIDGFVMDLAEAISKHSVTAIRLGKEAFYTQRDMEYYKSMDYLAESITTIMSTEDVKEGINAFFENRTPKWIGK